MDILGLTSSNQVRAILTVSESDLPDTVLESYGIVDDLRLDLISWVPSWETLTDPLEVLPLRLYAKYFCASLVATTADVFILKKKSDGENEGQRNGLSYAELANTLSRKAANYKSALLAELGNTPAAATTFISTASPDRDVITEGRSVS